jgi:hypothetical protein
MEKELAENAKNGEVETAKTDKEKAEVLANFYSSVFTREHGGDIPQLETLTPLRLFEANHLDQVICLD